MPYAVTALNLALDAITIDRIRLHSGDPGVNGTANTLGAGLSPATFAASGSAQRLLTTDVLVTGLAPNQSVTHFSVWLNTGTVFRGSFNISAGSDTQANAAGEYTLKATTTRMTAT